jgi:N-acylneuraminate cytidylyltransferase
LILAIIPARGGSKRLPGKNIAPFGGRPLLAWSVALAKRLSGVHCVVSTEDEAVARVARDAGAAVIDRPPELAGDDSSISEVMIHATLTAEKQGHSVDGIMLLQPTNPLRPLRMVEDAIARFTNEPCDSLISVSRRQLKTGTVEDGVFVRRYAADTQSRLASPVFYENGLLYLTKRATLVDRRSIYGERVLAAVSERPFDEVDIDEPIDLVIGEAVLAAVRPQLDYVS